MTSILWILFVGFWVALSSCSSPHTETSGTDTGNPVVHSIAGQVTHPQGYPVAKAQVVLIQSQPGFANDSTKVSTHTDSEGYYQVDYPYSGKVYIHVLAGDSLGYLDSLLLSDTLSSHTRALPLKPTGLLQILQGSYPAGTQLWVAPLGLWVSIGNADLSLSLPAGSYTLEFILPYTEETLEVPTSLPSADSVSLESSHLLLDSRDQQYYKTIAIGSQVWMAQNLNWGVLRSDSSTLQNGLVKYCYNNQPASCDVEGGLYQWHAALALPDSCAQAQCSHLITENHQGLCPEGWHIPSPAEWDLLATELGGDSIAGAKMKLNQTGDSLFDAPLYNDGNSSGFGAFPAGIRYFDGHFAYHGGEIRSGATFWELEEESSTFYLNAFRRIMNNEGPALTRAYNHSKKDAFSIRCIQNATPTPEVELDN